MHHSIEKGVKLIRFFQDSWVHVARIFMAKMSSMTSSVSSELDFFLAPKKIAKMNEIATWVIFSNG